MKVYIPTLGRVGKQKAYAALRPVLGDALVLVVQPHEAKMHAVQGPVVVLPEGVKGIAKTRQWIHEQAPDRYAMVDDDVVFQRRVQGRLATCSSGDIQALFAWADSALDRCPLVGVSARAGNNRVAAATQLATRQYTTHFVDRSWFDARGIRWDRLQFMEDFDVTLQVLGHGAPNIVTYEWAHSQAANAPGGCSLLRTYTSLASSARRLAELHPGLVRLVQKRAWAGMGQGHRIDVRVSWKKALAAGRHRL